ncbi:hypothetical protein L211DRAFT_798361, partial [Terfezia boudieri ATCC MYA-4762]
IVSGNFQIVLYAPEIVSSRNGSFWRRIVSKESVFKRWCGLLVVDEAYLIWGWYVQDSHLSFHADFLSLGNLRANFPNTPILTLSATMPPHIKSYVHKTLHLLTPTILYQGSINCPTISLMVVVIKYRAIPLKDLQPFIKESKDMLTTIVFVDDRVDYKVLAVEHHRSFQSEDSKAKLQELVRLFTSSCSQEYNAETLSLMHKQRVKIVFATACASNGIDFVGICRAIQYSLDPKQIDFCAFV